MDSPEKAPTSFPPFELDENKKFKPLINKLKGLGFTIEMKRDGGRWMLRLQKEEGEKIIEICITSTQDNQEKITANWTDGSDPVNQGGVLEFFGKNLITREGEDLLPPLIEAYHEITKSPNVTL